MRKVKIGEFLHRIKRPISLNPNDEYRLVTIKMHHKGVILRGLKKGADIKSKMYEVKEGDFILSGIDARNGAFGIVSKDLDGAIVTNDFWYFELDEEIIDKHFFLELTSTSWFDEICRLGSDGTTQRIRLQKDKFFNQEINLPPLEEQQEFISKFIGFKTINTDISNEIKNQQELLKKLRQSILQEAIEGKLTASWREQNSDVESASVLLEKIKTEKAQLVKDKKIKKQKPLPLISEDEIPFDIPDSWVWCRIGELIYDTSGGKSPKCENTPVEGEEWGVIKTTAIQDMFFNENKNKILPNGFDVLEHYIIHNGDLLITRAGPINRVGIVCEVKNLTKKLILSDKTIRMSHNKDFVSSTFLQYSLSNPIIKKLMENNMTGMADSQVNISQDNMKNFITILAPIEEQKVIVKKIETLFKICDELEEQINSSKTNSQILMQSVLKEAFKE